MIQRSRRPQRRNEGGSLEVRHRSVGIIRNLPARIQEVDVPDAAKVCACCGLFAGDDKVAYVLDPTRSHDVPESHFGIAVAGVLVVDRYSAYKAMRQVKLGQLVLAFC